MREIPHLKVKLLLGPTSQRLVQLSIAVDSYLHSLQFLRARSRDSDAKNASDALILSRQTQI